MKFLFLSGALLMASLLPAESVYDFTLKTIDGANMPLSAYKGKTLLLVNTASQCGYTPQYTGLEAIYRKYKDKGLVVLGVPANNFGGQEPGTNEEIKTFCSRNYKVSFPLSGKVSVTGNDQTPLFKYLSSVSGAPKWNFTKYLVDRNGKLIARFDSAVTPESPELTTAIENAMK